MTDQTLPLAGMRVIEIGHSVAAPYAALILAELGAEVIKVERPGAGDDARGWGPPFVDQMSAVYHALNRLKRSVTLDLKSAEGVAKLKALARISDALIQNQKPGLAESLGIGPRVLLAENPRLVYASIHAFGKTGPLKDRPGYDPLMQAFGGLMSVTGHPGQPAVRTGTSIIDMGTGMWVAMGIVTALLRRAETGKGGVVDTSLFETALGWMTYFLTTWSASGKAPGKAGSGTVMIAPYQAFPTADGELIIAAGNNNLFRRLSEAFGHPEWPADPRFADNGLRVENKSALVALIAAETVKSPTAEVAARLDAAGVPNAPVHGTDQVAAHPQTAAVGMLRGEGNLQFFGLPFSLDGTRPAREGTAHRLGEDDEWLEDLLAGGPSTI
ncbi:MAG TPA: CoA transferase [Thermohalobaculum sp.]|nr:CoA transferase [Thermohalobaculum sp.]